MNSNLLRTLPCILLLGLAAPLAGQPTAAPLDADQARKALEQAPLRPRGITKGWNPELSRSYGTSGATKGILVVKRKDGAEEKFSFVELPILFVKNEVEYFDAASRANLAALGTILNDLRQKNPGALFRVEGHASAEGAADRNLELSKLRAGKIRLALEQECQVPAAALSEAGYGKQFAQHPESAPEADRQKDRRVLVVRVR